MEPSTGIGEKIGKWIGNAVGEGVDLVILPTCRMAEVLFSLVRATVLADVFRTVRESRLTAHKARARILDAEATKAQAEAAAAAAISDDPKRLKALAEYKEQLAQLKVIERQADIDKKHAETAALKQETENRRIAAIADAQAKLLEAVSQLRQQGGDVMVSEENLRQILQRVEPSPGDTSGDASAPGEDDPAQE